MKNLIKRSYFYKILAAYIKYLFIIKPILLKQLDGSKSLLNRNKPFLNKRVVISLIETSHYFNYVLLAIAKSLELRGAEIFVIVCNKSLNGCEIKSIKNKSNFNNCFNCQFNLNKIVTLFKFKIIKINDLLNEKEREDLLSKAKFYVNSDLSINYKGYNLNQAIYDSVVRYFYGAVPLNSSDYTDIKLHHTETSLISLEVALKIDLKIKPDAVLSLMPCYSTFDPIFQYFKENGNRFRLISMNPYDFSKITLDILDLFKIDRYKKYLKSRDNKILTDEENKILNNFLENRFSGESEIFKKEGYFDTDSKYKIEKQLKIRSNVKNIFLFSNIYWDVGLSDLSGLYPDVISWVLDTIEILKNTESIHLYIKPHPGEVFDGSSSLKGISQIIREKYPILPGNLTIIEPEFKIKTYDLFEYIDVGVVFTGTLAIEMMMSGIDVVTVGTSPYQGLGFSDMPTTKIEYFKLLTNSLKKQYNLDELKLFSFFYFIKSSIPLNLTEKIYGLDFKGFDFNNLSELEYGKNKKLDHICDYIINNENVIPDSW